jgi:DNA-binding response OmpR family regulator
MEDQQATSAAVPQNGKRILCIEDEHFIAELYARALSKAGFDVKVVIDGQEGLKEALTNTYDIILLDIMVPTMTGIELLQRLRDAKLQPPLKAKIIITTNLEQSEENRANIESQADGYIIKAEMTPRQLADFVSQIKV